MVIAHIIAWAIFFVLPLLIGLNTDQAMTWKRYLGYVAIPLSCMVVFYVNYFLIIDRTLFRKKLREFLFVNVLVLCLVGGLLHLWQNYHREHFYEPVSEELQALHKARPRPPAIVFVGRDLLMMALTIGLSVAIRMTGNWYKSEQEKKELEKARTEAELQNLRSQLNPHFLFNTMNNIYSLIAIDPDRAQMAVHDLSKLMRHILYDNSQNFVELDRELEFMRSFVKLMNLRLPKHTELSVEIAPSGNGMLVAPLLFIALVENAFKHGVSPVASSFIRIVIRVEAPGTIYCLVENSYFPKKDNDRSGSGIGLSNLRRRLELLYPGSHTFEAERRGERFLAELKIGSR